MPRLQEQQNCPVIFFIKNISSCKIEVQEEFFTTNFRYLIFVFHPN